MFIISSVVLGTFTICYLIAHYYIVHYLLEENSFIKKNYNKDIFAFIFGLSNILLILIVLEIADIGDP